MRGLKKAEAGEILERGYQTLITLTRVPHTAGDRRKVGYWKSEPDPDFIRNRKG